jgi:serine/threonine protein kinase
MDETASLRIADDPERALVLAGRYELGESVGRGGMAEVYRARDAVLDRQVAVKVFRGETPLNELDLRRQTETQLLAGLSHPGLVTVFDAGTDDSGGTPRSYLVMELIDGPTLRELIARGPIPPRELAPLGIQVAEALAYVHGRGIVHRDVKPANILVTDPSLGHHDVVAKLTDFGVARLVESTRLTTHGMTVGTANYLSPEQATGADTTAASDIYALGLVLLECLTGQLAFPGYGVEAALARLRRDPVVPLDLPSGWGDLLSAMTARAPRDRPSAAEVATRLLPLATDRVPDPASGPTAVLAASSTRRRGVVLIVVAALAIAGIVGVVLLGGSSSPAAPRPSYSSVPGQLGRGLTQTPSPVGPSLSVVPTSAAPPSPITDASTSPPARTASRASRGKDRGHGG